MRIHYLQHVPFEDLGCLAPYFEANGYQLSATHLYKNHRLPDPDAFDWLIIMGGPMGVGDDHLYDWMPPEKALIKASIDAGKIVLGICLGAQLIASVLHARVYPNVHREIGWYPVVGSEQANTTILKYIIPSHLEVFHWHGDTFDIPDGCVPLASSPACSSQGFIMDNRVVGLQFHMETTPHGVKLLLDHCGHELDGSQFVQTKAEIITKMECCTPMNEAMVSLLKILEAHSMS